MQKTRASLVKPSPFLATMFVMWSGLIIMSFSLPTASVMPLGDHDRDEKHRFRDGPSA